MWAAKKQTGFTIVETLIVLAVTGFMFLATVIMINGQVPKYLFKDSMNKTMIRVSDAFNDVQTGYFPDINSSINVNCGVADTVASNGASSKCVIAGKRVTFTQDNLVIDTLIVDANSSDPFASAPGSFHTVSNLQQVVPYPGNIKFTSSFFPNPTSDNNTSDSSYNVLYSSYNPVLASTFSSGAQNVGVYYSDFNSMKSINSGNGRVVCFSDGGRTGSLLIGEKGTLGLTMIIGDSRC